jgi:hypothetical protein
VKVVLHALAVFAGGFWSGCAYAGFIAGAGLLHR